jgi:hypothetical protein
MPLLASIITYRITWMIGYQVLYGATSSPEVLSCCYDLTDFHLTSLMENWDNLSDVQRSTGLLHSTICHELALRHEDLLDIPVNQRQTEFSGEQINDLFADHTTQPGRSIFTISDWVTMHRAFRSSTWGG